MNDLPTQNRDQQSGSSIAVKAEFQRWEHVRDQARRQLTSTLTFGFMYLMASLAVGGYLLLTVREIARDAAIFQGWQIESVEIGWMESSCLALCWDRDWRPDCFSLFAVAHSRKSVKRFGA